MKLPLTSTSWKAVKFVFPFPAVHVFYFVPSQLREKPWETDSGFFQGCLMMYLKTTTIVIIIKKSSQKWIVQGQLTPVCYRISEITHPSSVIATHSCTSTPPRSLPPPSSLPTRKVRNIFVVTWSFSFLTVRGESVKEHWVHAPTTSQESGIIRIWFLFSFADETDWKCILRAHPFRFLYLLACINF